MFSGTGEGDVEQAFFLFELATLYSIVVRELAFGHSGDDDGVKFEAFGLVDGEDGDVGVVGGEEIEIAGKSGALGEGGE